MLIFIFIFEESNFKDLMVGERYVTLYEIAFMFKSPLE